MSEQPALIELRDFVTNNPFIIGTDFVVVRAQDNNQDFWCVKISPIENDQQERGFLFEKFTCEDVRTLNEFIESQEEFDAQFAFLQNLEILVVQFFREGMDPYVIFGDWPPEESPTEVS
jgi:hypothetical protein